MNDIACLFTMCFTIQAVAGISAELLLWREKKQAQKEKEQMEREQKEREQKEREEQ